MKQNTYTLTGHALDWAVAKCEGQDAVLDNGEVCTFKTIAFTEYKLVWQPSTNWAQGGVIIEREQMCVQPSMHEDAWFASSGDDNFAYGKTPLIAAMRCYVASKLGDTVDIPDELLTKETV